MSEKGLHDEMVEKVNDTSLDDTMDRDRNDAEPAALYLLACPECRKGTLDLTDSGVIKRSPILGITSDGEVGCLYTELTGEYQLGIRCRHCGHEVCSDLSVTGEVGDEFLSEWAKSSGQVRPVLPFTCRKCGSRELCQVEVGIEFSHDVLAVCEPDVPGTAPLIAVSHIREMNGRGTRRYRCSKGHELAKDDGTPVETVEELVAWLKAHSKGNKE